MPRPRPGIITTLGILNIIFGSLFLLCTLGSLTQSNAKITINKQDVTPAFKDFMNHEAPGYATYQVIIAVANLALAVCFIVSGVGMLQLAQWGRMLGLVCASLAILVQIGSGLYQLLVINPAVSKFFATVQDPFGFFEAFPKIMGTVTIIVALIGIGYNVLLLIALLLNSSARAFSGAGRDEYDHEEEEDEGWGDRAPSRRRMPPEEEDDEPYQGRRPGFDEGTPPRGRPARPQDEDEEDEGGDPRYRPPRGGR
jgi:hypothetical protein